MDFLKSGIKKYDRKLYQAAIEDFEKVDNFTDETYYYRGLCFYHLGNYENALVNLEEALALGLFEASTHIGHTYFQLGEYQKAIYQYDLLIEYYEERGRYFNPESYLGRGNAYQEMGKHEKAIQDFSSLLKEQPHYYKAYYNRAISYAALKEYKSAIQDCTQHIQIKPKSSNAYLFRADLYAKTNQIAEALKDINQYIQLNPDTPDGYHYRIAYYQELGVEKNKKNIEQDYATLIALCPEDSQIYQKRAFFYIEINQYQKALWDFDVIIEREGSSAQLHYHKAQVYFYWESYAEKLIAEASICIELQDNHIEAYLLRGTTFVERKEFDKAIQDFSKIIEIDAQNKDAYCGFGNVFVELGHYDTAVLYYDRAIMLDSKNETFYIKRGIAFTKSVRYKEAIQNFDIAISLNSENMQGYFQRGISHYDFQHYQEALQDFSTVANSKQCDEYQEAYYYRGHIYYVLGEYQKIVENYHETSPDYNCGYWKDKKSWVMYFWYLANAYFRLGKYDDALHYYDHIESEFSSEKYTQRIIDCCIHTQKVSFHALDYCRKLVKTEPQNAEAWFKYGLLHHFGKNYVLAIYEFSKVLELEAGHEGALHYLKKAQQMQLAEKNEEKCKQLYEEGTKFYDNEDYYQAIKCFEELLEWNPIYPFVHFKCGYSYTRLKNYKKAIQNYKIAMTLNPQDKAIYNNIGRCYRLLKQYDDAVACYQKALELDANYVEAYNNLGVYYEEIEQYAEAIKYYQKALQINPNFTIAADNLKEAEEKLSRQT